MRRFVGSYTYTHICVSLGTIVDRNKNSSSFLGGGHSFRFNRRTFRVQKDMVKKWLCILLSLFVYTSVWANKDSLSVAERNALQGFNDTIDRMADDFVKVSLVVCDPYEVLYSTLGHAALHLQCPIFNLDYIFTYEGENVREKIWTFLNGDLKMGMFAMTPDEFLESYRQTGRGVREYKINLSPEQEQKLWEVMDNHVAEGTNLPYDYFQRGCAKSVVQVVNEAIGKNAIHYAPWSDKYTKQTQRELVRNFITDAPWEEFVLYFLIGTEGDKSYPCEKKLIVPTDLVEVWQQATFDDGKPVLDPTERVLLDATKSNYGTWCTPLLVSLVLCIMALLSLITIWCSNRAICIAGEVVDYVLLIIYTFVGAVMTYLIVFSGLPCTEWNWLILPFNILPAICWHWRKYWALPFMAIVTIWSIVMAGQMIWGHVLVDWPHIVLALAFAAVLLKQYLVKTK